MLMFTSAVTLRPSTSLMPSHLSSVSASDKRRTFKNTYVAPKETIHSDESCAENLSSTFHRAYFRPLSIKEDGGTEPCDKKGYLQWKRLFRLAIEPCAKAAQEDGTKP